MEKSTGVIFGIDHAKELSKALGNHFDDEFIEVNNEDMTEKQMKEHRVSLKDNKSKLGKILVKSRKDKLKKKKNKRQYKKSKKSNRK